MCVCVSISTLRLRLTSLHFQSLRPPRAGRSPADSGAARGPRARFGQPRGAAAAALPELGGRQPEAGARATRRAGRARRARGRRAETPAPVAARAEAGR